MGAVKELLYREEVYPWEESLFEETEETQEMDVNPEVEKEQMVQLGREILHLKALLKEKEEKLKSWMQMSKVDKLEIDDKTAFAFVISESYELSSEGKRKFVSILKGLNKDPFQYLNVNKKDVLAIKKELGWTEEQIISFLGIEIQKRTSFKQVSL